MQVSSLGFRLAIVLLFFGAFCALRAAASPSPNPSCRWSSDFAGSDLDGSPEKFAVFDDGSGPALYAFGSFHTAGASVVGGVAKWDGRVWFPLVGSRGNGVAGRVSALVGYDDGTGPALYVGGQFSTAGGVSARNIAKWDGQEWSALGGSFDNGIQGEVHSLAVFDDGSGPALYAGGYFDSAGSVLARNVARWDGRRWSALGKGITSGEGDLVSAMAIFDDGNGPALYVAGRFQLAGGAPANSIAKWDGRFWSPLEGPAGNGIEGEVYALASHDDGAGAALYAGGSFGRAGGVPVRNVARWRDGAWSALTERTCSGPALVLDLISFDDGSGPALYLGGWFEAICSVSANYVVRWDGHHWSALEGPAGNGVDFLVWALATFDDGTGPALYAGGNFTTAGGLLASHVARWNGVVWSPLEGPTGSETDWSVKALAFFDDGTGSTFYVGGSFHYAGGQRVDHVARWDGNAFAPLSGPAGIGLGDGRYVPAEVYALESWDDGHGPALFAAGHFHSAGGIPAADLARWDGEQWHAIPGLEPSDDPSVRNRVYDLAVYDDGNGSALYLAGDFVFGAGVPLSHVARWDGSTLSPLVGPVQEGLDGTVYDLEVYDDGHGPMLYAAGAFHNAGGIPARYVARWDGRRWFALADPRGDELAGEVKALAVHDDGTGPALWAAGSFRMPDGRQLVLLMKWSGTDWMAMTEPAAALDGGIESLVNFDDGTGPALYAGGYFTAVGTTAVHYVARWKNGHFSPLEDGLGEGLDSVAYELKAGADERGPALFMVGEFHRAGGFSARHLAKWTCGVIATSKGDER